MSKRHIKKEKSPKKKYKEIERKHDDALAKIEKDNLVDAIMPCLVIQENSLMNKAFKIGVISIGMVASLKFSPEIILSKTVYLKSVVLSTGIYYGFDQICRREKISSRIDKIMYNYLKMHPESTKLEAINRIANNARIMKKLQTDFSEKEEEELYQYCTNALYAQSGGA